MDHDEALRNFKRLHKEQENVISWLALVFEGTT